MTSTEQYQTAIVNAASKRVDYLFNRTVPNIYDTTWFAQMVESNDGDVDGCIEWALEYAAAFGRKFEDADLDSEESEGLAYAAVCFMDSEVKAGNRFDYIVQMADAWKTKKRLTGGQVRGLLNCLRATALRRERSIDAEAFRDNLPNIIALFQTATQAGLKKPRIRFVVGDIKAVIYPAASSSKNAGSYYVKEQARYGEGDYYGKVTATGEVDQRLEANVAVVNALRSLNSNPEEAIAAYGRATGECGICGRLLTDKNSIARGIGPICADKYGL